MGYEGVPQAKKSLLRQVTAKLQHEHKKTVD